MHVDAWAHIGVDACGVHGCQSGLMLQDNLVHANDVGMGELRSHLAHQLLVVDGYFARGASTKQQCLYVHVPGDVAGLSRICTVWQHPHDRS